MEDLPQARGAAPASRRIDEVLGAGVERVRTWGTSGFTGQGLSSKRVEEGLRFSFRVWG